MAGVITYQASTINYSILNTSYNNTEETSPSEGSSVFDFILYTIIVPILFGIITLLGVLGNSLVIYVILTRQKMRTVTNLLLFNLALADLSFVVICPPFTAYQFATKKWPFSGDFGVMLCKLMHYLLNVTVYVTIYTLVLISIIRYMTVVHSHSTVRIRSRCNIILMIIAIWVIMLVTNVPAIIYHGVTIMDNGDPICDNAGIDFGRAYYSVFFVLAYILPLAVIAVFSLFILKHIQTRPTMLQTNKNSKSSNRKRKASQLLIMVVVIFAILWLPVHIHLLSAYWWTVPQSKFYKAISVLWNSMAYCNSCVNPFIYNYASKDFQESFREVVCCVKGYRYADTDKSICLGKTEMTVANGQNKEVTMKLNATGENSGDDEDCENV